MTIRKANADAAALSMSGDADGHVVDLCKDANARQEFDLRMWTALKPSHCLPPASGAITFAVSIHTISLTLPSTLWQLSTAENIVMPRNCERGLGTRACDGTMVF